MTFNKNIAKITAKRLINEVIDTDAKTLLTNKSIPPQFEKRISELLCGAKPLMSVVGDLKLNGKYGESAMLVCVDRLIAVDDLHENGGIMLLFEDIESVEVKRLYGNAIFRAKMNDSRTIDIIRFTYSATDLCDAVGDFIKHIKNGDDVEEHLQIVEITYNNLRCFCPKCGRKLASPHADCLNCKGKSKIISILYGYIKPHNKMLFVSIILSVITTAMALVPPYITKIMVDDIIPDKNMKMLIYTIIALLGVYLLQYSLGALRAYLLRLAGDRIIADLKKDIYAKAQYLPMKFYDKTSTGSIINRINSDTTQLQNFMLRITQEAVVQLFMMIGIIIIMIAMDWKLALFSLIPVPIVAILSRFFGKKLGPMYRRLWRRMSSISTILSDTIPSIKVIKSFTNEKSAINKFNRYVDDWMREDKTTAKISSIFPNAITFFVTCGSLVIWFVGGRYVINGVSDLTLGVLVSFISYASMFYNPVNFFASLSDSYQNALASTEKILDIINAEPEHNFGEGNTPKFFEGKIEFRNVNFSFDRSKKILNDVSFVIQPGETVGIVGTTGSGKSTIINLLMRFYDDYEGEILIDDVNIKDIDMDFFRSKIGFVQQEPLMFRDTIFNNIAYSLPGAHVDQVINAADIANAHTFISRLPDAYDTTLGERGVGLSGGEKQRLSIARAVLKNPNLMIFDEATSAVDSETEKLIQDAIDRVIRGRTTFMIAHRLSTLRKANRILVVDKGRIIENGSHNELMDLKGKYYKLIQIQSMSEKVAADKQAENFE